MDGAGCLGREVTGPVAFGLALAALALVVDLLVTVVVCEAIRRHLVRKTGDTKLSVGFGFDLLGAAQTFAVTALSGWALQVWWA